MSAMAETQTSPVGPRDHQHRWLQPMVHNGAIYRFCAEYACMAKWKHRIRERDINPMDPIWVVEPDEVQPI